jgi:hypothetical protein
MPLEERTQMLIESPSDNLRAVVLLQHAKRFTRTRFDGSWWILDFRLWELLPLLKGEEYTFAIQLVRAADWWRE